MQKIILMFGFDDLAGAQQVFALRQLTAAMEITVYPVGKEAYRRTLLSIVQSAAAGEKTGSTEPAAAEALPARMLVFAGFSDPELFRTLDLCPACGITRADLKAALTPANSRWNPRQLCENVLEEHRRLSGEAT